MVLPLIPAVIIAVGAVTGGGGIALGGKGAYDIKKSSDQLRAARGRYERRRRRSEKSVESTNSRLQDLGRQQNEALSNVVFRMLDFLRRHEKQIKEKDRLLLDGVEASSNTVEAPDRLKVQADAWARGAAGSAVVGAGANAAAMAAVTNVGVASTGAAISGLSGAAAESAALAWLGGGSLAAGGGGMALGGAALNFVTIGPALLVGGFVAKGQGKKAVTQAKAYEAKIAVALAELDALDTGLAAVVARADELGLLLVALVDRARIALDLLESETFDAVAHLDRFQQAMALAKAVADVASAPVVENSGELSERSANLTVKYRVMTEEIDNARAI